MDSIGVTTKGTLAVTEEGKPKRVLGFDLLRFLAVLAVIWFHVQAPGSEYTIWHVPTLIIISAVLACEPRKVFSFRLRVSNNAKRILLPWLFWCVVFGLADLVRYLYGGSSYIASVGYWGVLFGTSLHLWFLPFIFVVTMFAACLQGWVIKDSRGKRIAIWILFLCASIGFLLVTNGRTGWRDLPVPILQWVAAAPAVCLGGLLGVGVVGLKVLAKDEARASLFCVVGAGIVLAIAMAFKGLAYYSLVALGLVLLAIIWKGERAPRWLEYIASITMGVYLVHPLFVAIVRMCLSPSVKASVIHAVLAILCSVLFASLLVRTPLRSVV